MTKLVTPARRCRIVSDCTRVSFRRRRHQNIRARWYGYSEVADRFCLSPQATLVVEFWGPGIKRNVAWRSMPIVFNVKTAISLIFATCHFNSSRRVCIPLLLSRACTARCVSVGGGGIELPARKQARTTTKRNSYTCIMRTPTSDQHFKDKIVRIILEILW